MQDQPPYLSQRQARILASVIEVYVATGSPVGSKKLVQKTEIDVSSSTVRYELSVLEEQGLLTHPHTSAGRIPTDLGYRFYVDRLLEALHPRPTVPALALSTEEAQVDTALRATTEALAQVTHLLALVTAPPIESTMVRHVEVLLLQPQVIMVVVITSTGEVNKEAFNFEQSVDPGLAEWAREYLNDQLAGLQLGARLLRACFENPELSTLEREFLAVLRPAFLELVESGEQSLYVGGAAGLLDEFREEDLRSYQRLLEVLEQRVALLELMHVSLSSKQPFVRVGAELEDPELRRVSLVGAPYGLQHRNLGTVSLLGPTRMDYTKAIDAVRSAAHELSRFVEDLYEE